MDVGPHPPGRFRARQAALVRSAVPKESAGDPGEWQSHRQGMRHASPSGGIGQHGGFFYKRRLPLRVTLEIDDMVYNTYI
jgi:hypothetical protein